MENKANKIITKTLTIIFAVILIAGAVVGGYWLISRMTASLDQFPEEAQMRRLSTEVEDIERCESIYDEENGGFDAEAMGKFYEANKTNAYYYIYNSIGWTNGVEPKEYTGSYDDAVSVFNLFKETHAMFNYEKFDDFELEAWESTGFPISLIVPLGINLNVSDECCQIYAFGKVGNKYIYGCAQKWY